MILVITSQSGKGNTTTWTYLKYAFFAGSMWTILCCFYCCLCWGLNVPILRHKMSGHQVWGGWNFESTEKHAVEKTAVCGKKKVASPRISNKKTGHSETFVIYFPSAFVCFWSFVQGPKSVSVCRRSRCIFLDPKGPRHPNESFSWLARPRILGRPKGGDVCICIYIYI